MLRLICPLICLVCLGLAYSVGSVRKVICQSLSSISLLLLVPVDCDLADILTCWDSEYCSVIEELLLCLELLPVDFDFRIPKVLSSDYIPSGYVFDGHDDIIKSCSAEGFRLYKFLVPLDDLYSSSDDSFSYFIPSQINDLSILTDSKGSGPFSIQKISL